MKKPRIVIQFAVTAKEKRAMKRDARRKDLTLSDWLRMAAKREMQPMPTLPAPKFVGLLP